MSFNDPISELLTKIRNAKDAQHLFVDVSTSGIKLNIIKILKDRGFIRNFLVNDELKKIRIF
jgi:small subunit ribosomal protein S8